MIRLFALAGMAILAAALPAVAQTAPDRAGELKAWREQCSDPDTDLRIAYVEAALETRDTSIIRICVRQSLESDDSDIRNLGLRAALAALEQIRFDVEIPPTLAEAYEEAGDDEDKLREIGNWYIARDWASLQTGLVFEIDKANIVSGSSEWYPLVNRSARHDRVLGKAVITGDSVAWVGSATLAVPECNLNVSLVAGPALAGELLCNLGAPFRIVAKLL